jgi:NAD(P)-dependent dehydrogenase (short-subunit alcohol dehydrogenase family)
MARFDARSSTPVAHDFSKELTGRRALVTGGTRGMGAAIAQRLLDAGAKVVVTGRSRGEAIPAGATGAPADVFTQAVPLGRLGSPDDIAEVVALLVSDRANWMTGANILVDGGMTARRNVRS